MRPLRLAILGLAAVATFAGFFAASFVAFDRFAKRPADAQSSRWMPVLVVTPDAARVMANSEAGPFVAAHPEASFLVPEDRVDEVRARLRSGGRGDVAQTFSVETVAPGRQSVEVVCLGDGAWAGWYEATDKSVVPRYAKLYGPGLPILLAPVAGALTVALWAAAYAVRIAVRRRARRRSRSTAGSSSRRSAGGDSG